MKKKSFLMLFNFPLFVLFLNSCSPKNESNEKVLIHHKIDLENQILNYQESLRTDGGHSSTNYSVADSVGKYTVGYKFIIPDSVRSKNLKLYFSAWIRESVAPIEGGLVVAISNPSGILKWHSSIYSGQYSPNTWVLIRDSVVVEKELLAKEAINEIRIFGMKDRGSDLLNIDDIEFEYKSVN
jgi:hypothetical protein